LNSPIGLDLRDNSRQLSILKDGQKEVIFKDFTTPHSASPINASKMQKICRSDISDYIIKINFLSEKDHHTLLPPDLPNVSAVLQQFEDVFSDHMAIPPARECDHSIPLKEGSKPPNIRPYRIPYKQRDEVERLIQYMLRDSIIRPSSSPYSSPTIFMRKKDGSWRLYIDYRELNAQTVKNKFPIPVIEELLD
jgi:hypothetical protein